MKSIIKDTIALTAITLVAGLLLGFVYEITKDPISVQNEKAKQKSYQQVFQDADNFEVVTEESDAKYFAKVGTKVDDVTIDEIVLANDANGSLLGYVFTVTSSEGYGGDITFSIGITLGGTVNGISFLSISETAGLGMKANTSDFKEQFKNKQVESFQVTKTGASSDNEIDAISGATITSSAVTNGVNAGLTIYQYLEGGQ